MASPDVGKMNLTLPTFMWAIRRPLTRSDGGHGNPAPMGDSPLRLMDDGFPHRARGRWLRSSPLNGSLDAGSPTRMSEAL